MDNNRKIRPGDKISAMGHTFTVSEILFQDYYGRRSEAGRSDCWGYDVEFKDGNGRYHHWKQNQDHGYAMRGDDKTGYIVYGDDGILLRGDRIMIHWDQDGTDGYALVDYMGRNAEDGYVFRSVIYGWHYTLSADMETMTMDDHTGSWPATNYTGWMNLLP